jgi:hypothetical protein
MTEWIEINEILAIGISCHKCSRLISYALPVSHGEGVHIPCFCPHCQQELLNEKAWDWESVNELTVDISDVLWRNLNVKFQRQVT